jgi:hypothetical protein
MVSVHDPSTGPLFDAFHDRTPMAFGGDRVHNAPSQYCLERNEPNGNLGKIAAYGGDRVHNASHYCVERNEPNGNLGKIVAFGSDRVHNAPSQNCVERNEPTGNLGKMDV